MPQPIIILVETQLGENIGMSARAMLNCGLAEMRLVRPRDGWPNEAARATAADADRVLDGVAVFDHIDDAIADCHRVYATTARNRRLNIPGLDVDDAVTEMLAADAPGKTAILFGPEASGLDNETLSRADRLIHLATNPEFASLNLAQAVLLCCWQWWDRANPGQPAASSPVLAEKSATSAFVTRLEQALDGSGFFLTPELKPDTLRTLRTIFTRSNLTPEELRMLHGVLTALKGD